MVSLLLGSILLALSFNLYYSTKKSEQLATSVLNAQTESRNALHLIRHSIEHAGYTTEVNSNIPKSTIFKANDRFNQGQVLRISGTNSQTLLVRLQGDAERPLRACNGETIPTVTATSDQETWYEFYTQGDQLLCQVYQNEIAFGEATIIAQPVAALKLRSFSGTQAKTILATDSQADDIKSVQVQLVVRSQNKTRAENAISTIKLTGFNALTFNDQYFYTNTNRYFLAKNQ